MGQDYGAAASFGARYLQGILSPAEFLRQERQKYRGAHPGFLSVTAYALLTALVLASVHHLLQALFPRNRYLVTDLYFLGWLVLMLGTGLCHAGLINACLPAVWPAAFTVLAVYRLLEILPRELWIIMYRQVPLSSFPRVLSVALINYATIVALFGYLYADGADGFALAGRISLSFSPQSELEQLPLQFLQSAYCFTFVVIVLAVFVGRVRLKEDQS